VVGRQGYGANDTWKGMRSREIIVEKVEDGILV
jgi:hypothetical protein